MSVPGNESLSSPSGGEGSEGSLGSAILRDIRQRAKSTNQRIVLPESTDDRVLHAADAVLREGLAAITLLGDTERILSRASQLNLELGRAAIIDPADSEFSERFAQSYYQRRMHKGVTQDQARQIITDPVLFGASLVRAGICGGMVAGAITTTAKVIRSALHCVGLADGLKTLSSFFLMVTGRTEYGAKGAFIFADGGCVPDPTSEQLVDIALASARHCRLVLQTDPLIAFLSFSTSGSAKHPLVEKVRKAAELFRDRHGDYKSQGELQLDAAIVPAVAASKVGGSEVAGRANVLIFPDLNAGNIGCKLVERLAGARAIGPTLQGLDLPVNDVSRGCGWRDIVDSVAITVLQAEDRRLRQSHQSDSAGTNRQ